MSRASDTSQEENELSDEDDIARTVQALSVCSLSAERAANMKVGSKLWDAAIAGK